MVGSSCFLAISSSSRPVQWNCLRARQYSPSYARIELAKKEPPQVRRALQALGTEGLDCVAKLLEGLPALVTASPIAAWTGTSYQPGIKPILRPFRESRKTGPTLRQGV